jgi:hypothetical protein
MRRRARRRPAFEGLDDAHAAAAAGTRWTLIGRLGRFDRIGRRRHGEQFTRVFEAGLASGAGEQAVVADAMEAARQHVEQETANELVRRERHDLLSIGASRR